MFELKIKPCSYNQYYRIMRSRYIISPIGQKFRNDIYNLIQPLNTTCYNCEVEMNINFYFSDKRQRDLDNLLKALIDSLKNICFTDDNLIFKLSCSKTYGCEYDFIRFDVKPINQQQKIKKKVVITKKLKNNETADITN